MTFSNAQLAIDHSALFNKPRTDESEMDQIPRLLADIPALRPESGTAIFSVAQFKSAVFTLENQSLESDAATFSVVQFKPTVFALENQKLYPYAPIPSFPELMDAIEQWRLHQFLLDPINNYRISQSLTVAETVESVADLLENFDMIESAERLRVLNSEEDTEEGHKPLSLESVKNYAEFRNAFRDFGEPLLGVSPDGILGADWKLDSGHYIGLSFESDGQVIYAIVFPSADPDNPDQKYDQVDRQEAIRVLREIESSP